MQVTGVTGPGRKSHETGIEPRSAAPEADSFTTRPTRRSCPADLLEVLIQPWWQRMGMTIPEREWMKMRLTLNFLVAVVSTSNTKTHSCKEKAEFSFENENVRSICYCKQRMKSKLSLSSECVKTKLCKLCTSFLLTPTQLVWNRVV